MSSDGALKLTYHDRRVFGRRGTVWHAWILTSARQRLACCVRNVSHGGALLELDVPAWLPHTFELFIEERDLRIPCGLRHRGRHGVGVQFSDTDKARALLAICRAASDATPAQSAADAAPLPRPRLTPDMIMRALHRAPD